jgi:hypothetical protein
MTYGSLNRWDFQMARSSSDARRYDVLGTRPANLGLWDTIGLKRCPYGGAH